MLYDITPSFSPHFKHPAELLMERLGQFPRAERRVIDLIRHWLTRPGRTALPHDDAGMVGRRRPVLPVYRFSRLCPSARNRGVGYPRTVAEEG